MLGADPFAECGLNGTFSLAVGAWGVRTSAGMANVELLTDLAEAVGTTAAAVIGQQGAHGDVVAGVEGDGIAQGAEGGLCLLIGEQWGEGEAGVVVGSDMQGLASGIAT